MSALPRESSFMPTIKCSACGIQIEISSMGEHICGVAAPEPPMPPLDIYSSYSKSANDRFGRMPPRVDTSAANRPFLRQGQLTPVSTSSGSRSLSPRTPDGRPGPGRGNDYFEPKIANEYESTPPQTRRGGYGGYSDRDEFEMDPMYPATSPRKKDGFLQRMNTIAPGPFEMGGARRGQARNAFAPGSDNNDYARAGYTIERPGTAASNKSMLSSSNNSNSGVQPPRIPRKNGYGGFGPPPKSQDDFEPQPFSANNRAGTFPRPSDPMEAPLRTPSAPGPRPDRFRRPSNNDDGRPSVRGPDTSRPPPPRTSLVRPRTAGRDAPPAVNLAAEFGIGNPYHTASESMSSAVSTYSRPSAPSSNSSPARSGSTRNHSDTSSFDNLMSDLQYSMNGSAPKDLPPTPPQPAPFDKPSASTASRSDVRQNDLWFDQAAPGSRGRDRAPPPQPQYDLRAEMARISPPSLRSGRRYGVDARGKGSFDAGFRYGGYTEASPPRSLSPKPFHHDLTAQPSRGPCKACGEQIRGKSISSADGRLTGRYHKACFVCTACTEPFSSAEFYVHNDQPYCKLHYHKLNGSLCGSCGKGIEGEYLEDETMVKYHVGCFRCGDCGMSLSAGYFEVDGKAYCERDAWKRAQQPVFGSAYPTQETVGSSRDPFLPPPTTRTPSPLAMASPAFDQSPAPPPTRAPSSATGLPQRPSSRRPSVSHLNNNSVQLSQGLPPSVPGLPRGQRLGPGMGPTPRPRMNKRMTRLGMM